jgi:hypothetical protein
MPEIFFENVNQVSVPFLRTLGTNGLKHKGKNNSFVLLKIGLADYRSI